MPDSNDRLNELRQRWEADPGSRVFVQLGEEYRKLGRHEEAVRVLEEGLGRSPNQVSAQVALGRCRLEMGQLDSAIAVLEGVLAKDRTQLVANKLTAEAYLLKGELDLAADRLDLYRQLNDGDPEIGQLDQRLANARAERRLESARAEERLLAVGDSERDAAQAPEGGEAHDDLDVGSWADLNPVLEQGEAAAATVSDSEVKPPPLPGSAAELTPPAGTITSDERPAALDIVQPEPQPQLSSRPEGEPFPELAAARDRRRYDEALLAAGLFAVGERRAEPAPPEPRASAEEQLFDLEPKPRRAASAEQLFDLPPVGADDAPAGDLDLPASAGAEDLAPFDGLEPRGMQHPEPAVESLELAPPADALEDIADRPDGEEADTELRGMEEPVPSPEAPELAPPPVEGEPPDWPSEALAEPTGAETEGGDPEAATREAESEPALEEPARDETEGAQTADRPELAAGPGVEPISATLGQLYLQQGHPEEARKIFRQVLERDPAHPVALAGIAALDQREPAAAEPGAVESRVADERAAEDLADAESADAESADARTGVSSAEAAGGWPLSAADLLAGSEARAAAGLTEKKKVLLRSYLRRLRPGR